MPVVDVHGGDVDLSHGSRLFPPRTGGRLREFPCWSSSQKWLLVAFGMTFFGGLFDILVFTPPLVVYFVFLVAGGGWLAGNLHTVQRARSQGASKPGQGSVSHFIAITIEHELHTLQWAFMDSPLSEVCFFFSWKQELLFHNKTCPNY